jgi:LPS-assembly protein
MGEYHQAFKNSNFLADFGYTEGFKKNTPKKKSGDKSHFFSEFTKNFKFDKNASSSFKFKVQEVSNDKYLKLYKLDSDLVDYNSSTLENSVDFTYENDDLFFGFNSSIYETLREDYTDKYEYIYPDITIDKNLFSSNKFGKLDLQSNYQVKKYETNKFTNFFINDFDWSYKILNNSVFNSKLLGNIKNINYETKNIDIYKKDTTSEVFGALGYLTKINFEKSNNKSTHYLTPKILLRYAPGQMRNEQSGSRLNPLTSFSLNRLNNPRNFETGLSGTVGFDYKINNKDRDFDFSIAQIISEKENKKMPSITSLDEKMSDLVGSASAKINDKLELGYNFSIDQNYNDLNYNDFETKINFDPMKIGFNYILENKHIGDQEYFKTKVDYNQNNNNLFSFETKRNLITDSAEFYNLSYEYLNDCLRAGLVYRREFYKDSEIEPENSLMFKITLTPFGNINSPSFTQ